MKQRATEGYRLLEHTSDALIEAWGPNLEGAFVQAANAFYDTMLNRLSVKPRTEDLVQAEGHDEKELLYDWLEVLLLKFDIEGMVYSEFAISPITSRNSSLHIQAKIRGEKYVRATHGSKVEIKGITYHLMEIKQDPHRATVQFLLDL
jgi:SHS2 domain-containing protein